MMNGTESALRRGIQDLVGRDYLRSLETVRVSRTIQDAALILVTLASSIAVVCLTARSAPGALLLVGPPCMLLIGIAFNWINVQIHEASHGLLFSDSPKNDLFCDIVLGSLALQDVEGYRQTHFLHHSDLHTDRDPDLPIYTDDVGGVRDLLRGIAKDLTGVSACQRVLFVPRFLERHSLPSRPRSGYVPIAKATAQVLVIAAFSLGVGSFVWGVALYALFYLYPLLAIFPLLIRIRTVVQHYDRLPLPELAKEFVARSTESGLAQRVLVGARMDYHFEHHLFPGLPYYNLGNLHRKLRSRGFFGDSFREHGHEYRTSDFVRYYAKVASG